MIIKSIGVTSFVPAIGIKEQQAKKILTPLTSSREFIVISSMPPYRQYKPMISYMYSPYTFYWYNYKQNILLLRCNTRWVVVNPNYRQRIVFYSMRQIMGYVK